MKVAVVFISLLLVAAAAYAYAVVSPNRISSQDARAKLKKNEFDIVLDVRTDYEVKSLGKYPNSVHIQAADLNEEMAKRYPDKKTRILAYCNTGHRARLATDKLHSLGYENAVYISSPYTELL